MEETVDSDDKERLRLSWRMYLLEYEYAKYYDRANLLSGGSMLRNPVLDFLLPSLLLIRVVSILDAALQFELDRQSVRLPKGVYHDDLKGRIGILGDSGKLSTKDNLQSLRCRRNDLAHKLLFATWDELSAAVDLVEAALQELAIVGARPTLEYFGERSAVSESPDPNALFIRKFKCGIKENGQVALEHSWTEKL